MNMDVHLAPGLELTATQPDYIKSTFTEPSQVFSTIAEDERGQAFLFERFKSPAVFIEVIRTLPNRIRGNHVHQYCAETLHAISGEIELYLLCRHKKHVFKRTMKKGEAVITPKGTPHALRSLEESECVVFFDKDPRQDRARVHILEFNS